MRDNDGNDNSNTVVPWWKFLRRRPRTSNNESPEIIKLPHDEHEPSKVSTTNVNGWRSYQRLLIENRNYRLYLCSHFCQHTGDWFVHVASLIAIEQLVPDSGTAISILIATKMIPMILFTSFGGALADKLDRRKLMIVFDTWNASVALLYLVALYESSPIMLYVVSFIRHTVVAMYEPITRSIVPMLVSTDEELKIAMTLNGMAWATTLAVGGTLAGWSAATLGVGACYVGDSVTYIISTIVIWMVRGTYSVGKDVGGHTIQNDEELLRHDDVVDASTAVQTETKDCWLSKVTSCIRRAFSPITSFVRMFFELTRYLGTCQFGMLVFLKATGNITWGSADIINVSLASVKDNDLATSTNIGFIYSSVGLGCLLGPIIANIFTDMSRPATLQMVCVAAIGFIVIGWLGMATNNHNLGWLCLFNSIRAFGSSIIWINSTLILQKLTSRLLLGRVLSFDFATTMLCDTIASFAAGIDEDSGVTTSYIASCASIIVGSLWFFWSLYHMGGNGAARKTFNVGNNASSPSPSVSLHEELERLGCTGGDLRLVESGAQQNF